MFLLTRSPISQVNPGPVIIYKYCICFLVPAFWFGCQPNPTKIETDSPIKIGILAPYQGVGYRYLTDLHRGLDLAFHDAGNFHLIYENCDLTTVHGKNAVEKLIKKDRVLAIIGGDSPEVIRQVADSVQAYQVLFFPGLLPITEDYQKNTFLFSTLPSLEQLTQTLLEFKVKKLNTDKVAIIYQNDGYHRDLAGLLRDALTSKELKVMRRVDSLPTVDKSRLKECGLIYLLTNYDSTLSSLNNIRSKGFTGTVIGSNLSIRYPVSGNLQDTYYYYPRLMLKEHGRNFRRFKKTFLEYHEKITNRFPELFEHIPNRFEAQAYEAGEILVQAISEAGTDPEILSDYLRAGRFQSLAGTLQFPPDKPLDRKFEMVQLVNGQEKILN